MVRIAREVESRIDFKSYPPAGCTETQALSEAANTIAKVVNLRCIVVLTTSGHTARFVAAERPRVPVIALTHDAGVYHVLNLFWGIRPLLVQAKPTSFEGLLELTESILTARQLAAGGDKILILGGMPPWQPLGTNFAKIHTVR
jgi:pyruvate kinase